jgi:hypothetical protein
VDTGRAVAFKGAWATPESWLTGFVLLATASAAVEVVLDRSADRTISGTVTVERVEVGLAVSAPSFAAGASAVFVFEAELAALAGEPGGDELASALTVSFTFASECALSLGFAEEIGTTGLLETGVTVTGTVATGIGDAVAELVAAGTGRTTLRDESGCVDELLATSLSLLSSNGGRLGRAESGT